MIQMRHVGIYVRDLVRMQEFYQKVFRMHRICDKIALENALLPALTGAGGAQIHMTKLITEQGRVSGHGDMVELLAMTPQSVGSGKKGTGIHDITTPGHIHLCFGVDDLAKTLREIARCGGTVIIDTISVENGRKCAFAADPEGNLLELIQ